MVAGAIDRRLADAKEYNSELLAHLVADLQAHAADAVAALRDEVMTELAMVRDEVLARVDQLQFGDSAETAVSRQARRRDRQKARVRARGIIRDRCDCLTEGSAASR
jgi:hypothetical protein